MAKIISHVLINLDQLEDLIVFFFFEEGRPYSLKTLDSTCHGFMRNGELYSYKEIYNTITKELISNQLIIHPLN